MSQVFDSVVATLRKESESILEALGSIDLDAVEQLVDQITGCKGKVILSGCGTSGAAAKKIAHTFCCVSRPALFMEPSDAVHGGLGVVSGQDIVILISKGGASVEINSLIQPCKAVRAFIVGVTENEDSALARESDLFIRIKVKQEADDTGLLATSSIIGVIAVFDAVAIAAAKNTGFSLERFRVIHPGGAVGEKLSSTAVPADGK